MELAISVFSGFIYKLYDDLTDNNIAISSLTMEFIKVFLVASTTFLMVKSTDLTLAFAMLSIMCFVVNQFDTDFWKAWASLPFLILLYHLPYFSSLSFRDIGVRLLLLSLGLGIVYFEAKLFPEEISLRKYASRISLAVASAILAYLASIYEFQYLVSTLLFFVGYHSSSVIFHFNTVFQGTGILEKKSTPSE
jgi:hypothetical protein